MLWMPIRLGLTKSGSRDVPPYSIDARSGLLKHKFERTPRISIITDEKGMSPMPKEIPYRYSGPARRAVPEPAARGAQDRRSAR